MVDKGDNVVVSVDELYKDGMTVEEIAYILGMKETTIRHIVGLTRY